ncbi:uncharacterized protein LOC142983598 [Anticarsia gemmatalis]|uniref:uncharacterized protein LOC142983598 n=1 Tax=Anticarsia gemmatalis TaxID=129554 RepID=UPI003F7642FF
MKRGVGVLCFISIYVTVTLAARSPQEIRTRRTQGAPNRTTPLWLRRGSPNQQTNEPIYSYIDHGSYKRSHNNNNRLGNRNINTRRQYHSNQNANTDINNKINKNINKQAKTTKQNNNNKDKETLHNINTANRPSHTGKNIKIIHEQGPSHQTAHPVDIKLGEILKETFAKRPKVPVKEAKPDPHLDEVVKKVKESPHFETERKMIEEQVLQDLNMVTIPEYGLVERQILGLS